MKRLLFALFLGMLSAAFAGEMSIENEFYNIKYDDVAQSFSFVGKSVTGCKVEKATLHQDVSNAKVEKYRDSVWGTGKSILCTHKDTSSTRLTLFDNIPFVVMQSSLHNGTDKQVAIKTHDVISLELGFDCDSSKLAVRGSDELKPLGDKAGSYVFSAIADSDTGCGVVSAWLSHNRGCGIVFHEDKNGKPVHHSVVDYGDLRLNPNQTETGEILFIGLFRDVRLGLENFADNIATFYNIKLHPVPSVYCTWYHNRASSEKEILKNTDFSKDNLKDFGFSVIQIDDGWQDGSSGGNGPIKVFDNVAPKGPYPGGMKQTADNIKSRGLVPGIWFMPFAGTWSDPHYADKQDIFYKVGKAVNTAATLREAKRAGIEIKDIEQAPYADIWGGSCIDMTNPKSREYLRYIVQTITDWGYEYFKMDGLYTGFGVPHLYYSTAYLTQNSKPRDDDFGKTTRFNPMMTPVEAYKKGFQIIRDTAGDDIFFLGCCMIQNQRSFGPTFGCVDAMRVGPDNGPSMNKLQLGPNFVTRSYFLNKRVWHNDPDPVYFRAELPDKSVKCLATWVALSGSLVAGSDDYTNLPDDRLDIFKRMMPIHNSKECRPLDYVKRNISHEWLLQDNSSGIERRILGHYNWDMEKIQTIETKLSALGLDEDKEYVGFDYWNNEFIPPFTKTISSTLSPHSCRDIAIYPAKKHPQIISTSRHITQGIIDIKSEKWDWGKLTAICDVVKNDPYEIRIAVPAGKSWALDAVTLKKAPDGTTTAFEQDGTNIRVKVNSLKTAEIGIIFTFKKVGINIPKSCKTEKPKPNILFCLADDWGWPHAGSYGDPVVKTPTFDRLAAEGVIFEHAYVSSPSCTPSRGAILTGQYHWRLKEGANLRSTLDVNIPVYPLLLQEAGYHVGYQRKGWAPGDVKAGGYIDLNPCGTEYPKGFRQFLDSQPKDKPFCFWLGSYDPHRGYKKGSGKDSGMPVDKVKVPTFYPDVEEIRSDIADYYFEVQRFDTLCGNAIKMLEEIGELENTLIVMTGDHGMPFPRCKSNIYDMGVRVPMAIRWGNEITAGRRLTDFMSTVDLAPTFLDAAGVKIPDPMTGRSLLPILRSKKQGRVESRRNHVIFGKERHVPAQKAPSIDGYPCRGIRTDQYLYIRNFKPDRWPAGVPSGATHRIGKFADCDDGPTKQFLMEHKDDPTIRPYYDWSFAKREAEELYDLEKDPDQLINLADDESYSEIKKKLSSLLMKELKDTADPRVVGNGDIFDQYPYGSPYKLK